MKLKALLLLVISLVLFAGCDENSASPQCAVTPSTQEDCDKMGENSCLKFKLEGEGCAARCVIDNDASKACPNTTACTQKTDPSDPCKKFKLDFKIEDGKVTAECVEDTAATATAKVKDPTTPNQCCPDPALYSTEDADCHAPAKSVNVGDQCTDNSTCGTDGTCIQETTDGTFKDGYCSIDCSVSGDICPTGSTCREINVVGSGIKHQCLKNCSDSNGLRAGYTCHKSTVAPICKQNTDCDPDEICDIKDPAKPLEAKCIKAKNIGDECSKDDDCNGVAGGICLIYDTKNNKGICTAQCRNVSQCSDQTNRTQPGEGFRCASSSHRRTYCFPACNDANKQKDNTKCTTLNPNLSCMQTATSIRFGGTDFICRPPIEEGIVGKACNDYTECAGYSCNIYVKNGSCQIALLDNDEKTDRCPKETKNINGECKEICAQNSDCRELEGYTCDMTNRLCEPPNPRTVKFFGRVGKPCTDDDQCKDTSGGAAGTNDYTCFKEGTLSSTGYCIPKTCNKSTPNITEPKTAQNACPGTSWCTPYASEYLCVIPCPSDITGADDFCKAQMDRDDVVCREIDSKNHIGICFL